MRDSHCDHCLRNRKKQKLSGEIMGQSSSDGDGTFCTVVLSAQLSGALGPYPVELPHPFVVSYIFL